MFRRDGARNGFDHLFGKSDCRESRRPRTLTPEKKLAPRPDGDGTLRKRPALFIDSEIKRAQSKAECVIKIKLDAGATCGTNWMELAPVPQTGDILAAKIDRCTQEEE